MLIYCSQLRDNLLDLALNKELQLKALDNKMSFMEQTVKSVCDEMNSKIDSQASLQDTQLKDFRSQVLSIDFGLLNVSKYRIYTYFWKVNMYVYKPYGFPK